MKGNSTKIFLQSLKGGCLSSGFYTLCFTLLAFFFDGANLRIDPIAMIFTISLILNIIGLSGIHIYMANYRDRAVERLTNEALSSDEKARNMFNWCLAYGMIVILLTVLIYAIAARINYNIPFAYDFLAFALMPISPWTGRIALDHFNELIDETPLSACFFHTGKI